MDRLPPICPFVVPPPPRRIPVQPVRPDPGAPPEVARRYLLYSHDSYGLGHLRRNLTLAAELARPGSGSSVVIATGSPAATFFELPPGVEVVKLPAVTKDEDGRYEPRSLPGPLADTLRLRRHLLEATFAAYRPHALLVDHQVLGLHGEVLPLLRRARAEGVYTALGLRDVIDSPEVVAREWGTKDARWALSEGYDRVFVYGDPSVLDPRLDVPVPPELGASLEFVGYVVRPFPRHSRRPVPPLEPQVLVTVGGGEDGVERLDCVLTAVEGGLDGSRVVVVGGPLLDSREARRLKRRARELPHVELHRFHADLPRLLADSDLVVCMAGYNTCAEVLRSGRRAIFLPRTFPRREQAIRAERLTRLGLGTTLEQPTPGTLREAIRSELDGRSALEHSAPCRPPLDGARTLARRLEGLLGASDAGARSSSGSGPRARRLAGGARPLTQENFLSMDGGQAAGGSA